MVVADADAVFKLSSFHTSRLPGDARALVGAYVFFFDGEKGLDAAGFADVGVFGEAVFGAHYIFTEADAGPAFAAVRARGFGLEPV